MKYLTFFLLFIEYVTNAQQTFTNLQQAFQQLSAKEAFQQANISFTLLDIKTGSILFEKNKDQYLAPASTLKTFTTAAALNALGENFRYQTKIAFKGEIKNKVGNGELIVYACGDPSFGSDRFPECNAEAVKKQIVTALRQKGIETLNGNIRIVNNLFSDTAINTGWLDEDVGNYYGAGIYSLNWRENKFEINMMPSKNSFVITSNSAGYDNTKDFCIEIIHKDGATTEEAFAYIEKNKACSFALRGVLSAKEKTHNMQLARLHPDEDFTTELTNYLNKELKFTKAELPTSSKEVLITTLISPPLSKLVYWCNQKSLNLYAESFCKTMAVKYFKKGTWTLGIATMLMYANKLGINTKQIHLKDASGLAPENKITTAILARLLQGASKASWYKTFYESLPSMNGLIMKSGYIGGTRSYAGYIKLKDGRDASFAYIVNKYTCTPKETKIEMYRILDLLK